MPMGNIKCDDVADYIRAGAPVVGIGRDLCEEKDLEKITKRAKKLLEELKQV